jgi:hypothetical protein
MATLLGFFKKDYNQACGYPFRRPCYRILDLETFLLLEGYTKWHCPTGTPVHRAAHATWKKVGSPFVIHVNYAIGMAMLWESVDPMESVEYGLPENMKVLKKGAR